MSAARWLAWVLACTAVAAHAAEVERLPVEYFGKRPFLEDPELSPNGEMMAALVDADGKEVVAIFNLVDKTKGTKMVAVGDHEVRWIDWAGPDRVLISLLMDATIDGYETKMTRLISYEVSTGKATSLGFNSQGFYGDDVIFIARDGSYVLLSLSRAAYYYPSVYRADLATGEMKIVIEAREPILAWQADAEGVVRAGIGFEGGHIRIFTRESEDDWYFRHSAAFRAEDKDGEIDTIRINKVTGSGLVVTNAKTGKFALYDFDWKTMEVGKPIYENATVDIDDFSMTEDGTAVEAVYYTDDRRRVEWLQPDMKKVQEELDAAMVGRMNYIEDVSRDRKKFLVWTGTASDPGSYYLYDRDAEQLTRIATPYEVLRGKQLSPMKVVSYKARDGLEVPAYLTLPAGREPKNLPLVLLPHGGPHVRDSWAFDYWVQFLANRGYAVLQPNFRGSAGYGVEFLKKGFGQWGAGMQDDLTDGVQWLINEGTVDPKRVCILGASYGGYAALMGAIKTPELFRCAVSWAGVTDVPAIMRHDKNHMLPSRYRRFRDRMKGEGDANLRDVSPVRRAADVAIPVLLMHGTEDEIVPFHQAEEFVKAMKRAGKPLEYIEFADVEHNFEKSADRIKFLTAVEAFLAKHNPADLPP